MKKNAAHQLAEKWIQELTYAGYSYDDMIAIFKDARLKYENFKKRKAAKK